MTSSLPVPAPPLINAAHKRRVVRPHQIMHPPGDLNESRALIVEFHVEIQSFEFTSKAAAIFGDLVDG